MASLDNHQKLQQQCDYIILFPEVNEMQKLRVALALLYLFLSTCFANSEHHEQFCDSSAELFGLKSRPNKLLQEVFNLFLKEHYDLKLAALKKDISFVKYRRCTSYPTAKRTSHNNSSSTAPRLSESH
jgi:hypothetical protein